VLEIILTFIAVWSGYKRAKVVGRQPVLWASLAGTTFLGAWVGCSTCIAMGILIASKLGRWREDIYGEHINLINAICIVAGLLSLLGVFYFMDNGVRKLRGDISGLPPPPKFDKNI
jgi:hypothetical protein